MSKNMEPIAIGDVYLVKQRGEFGEMVLEVIIIGISPSEEFFKVVLSNRKQMWIKKRDLIEKIGYTPLKIDEEDGPEAESED